MKERKKKKTIEEWDSSSTHKLQFLVTVLGCLCTV